MRKKIIISVLLLAVAILFLSSVSLASPSEISTIETIEVSEAKINAESSFGAGSDFPLITPMDLGYVHVSTKQPANMVWTVYDPGFHQVVILEHPPSTIYQEGTEWRFADKTVFTLPAFAQEGNWVASCKVVYTDGTSTDINWDEYIYQGIPCGNSGDIFGNIFIYPWYFFGYKLPALFWFPGILFWSPLVYLAFALLMNRAFPGFVDVTRQWTATVRKSVGRSKKRSKKRKSLLKK